MLGPSWREVGFLTTDPIAEVKVVHREAMSVILTTAAEFES